MKALIISDSHGLHDAWEKQFTIPKDIEMIIHGGDLTNVGSLSDFTKFSYWFINLPIKHKIMIAGNHDFGLENNNKYMILEMFRGSGVHYLEDSGVEIEGIKFWGSPVTPPFFNWAFMRDPETIKKHWDAIPDDTDVLITHSPPRGHLDYVARDNKNAGCPILAERVKVIKPKLHIFGHIHEPYGMETVDGITYVNAAILNDAYMPVRGGHKIEIIK